MSRSIAVRVVDKDGYGLAGYAVKTYGGNVVKTDRDGEAVVQAGGSQVTIYVNGSTEFSGSTVNCKNPLVVRR